MKSWSFVYVSDIHVGSLRSFRFEPAWNENWQTARKQILEINPDFLLVGGDLTRDGNLHNYELKAIKKDLDKLPFPYHVVPGNMDTGNKHTDVSGPLDGRNDVELNLTSEHLERFSSFFGPLWWSFDHKGIRFSGFCDMVAGSGLTEEEDLWNWMQLQQEKRAAKKQVWVTHYPLFIENLYESNFDITNPNQYYDWYFGIDARPRDKIVNVFKATSTDIVISGHVHCHKVHSAESMEFIIAPSTAFPQWENRWNDGDPRLGFLKFTVSGQRINYEFVPLSKRSELEGYGPHGHPSLDQIDN